MKRMSDTTIYQQYLKNLKCTVESLLITQVANLWSIYGGLNRLHLCLEKIFKHGCKNVSEEGIFYNFIQGLEWLQPESTKSFFNLDCEYDSHIPSTIKNDKSSIWLYRNLESHSLSAKLSWLFSDTAHLYSCYEPWAFLCQKEYADATLICLKAVERNQATYLAEVNPCLFLKNANTKELIKSHRRSSSFPDSHFKFAIKNKNNVLEDIPDSGKVATESINTKHVLGKLKPWSSLPALQIDSELRKPDPKLNFLNRTMPNTPVHLRKSSPTLFPTEKNSNTRRKKKNKLNFRKYTKKCKVPQEKVNAIVINNNNIIEHTPSSSCSPNTGVSMYSNEEGHWSLHSSTELGRSCSIDNATYEKDDEQTETLRFQNCSVATDMHSTNSSNSTFSHLSLLNAETLGEKDYRPKRFIEDGGMSILPMSTGYFPKPAKGQTLTSFLNISKQERSRAELDRENAHFSISEAIISAMEQIKYNRNVNLINEEQLDDSDPEITELKQRIRLRRKQKFRELKKKEAALNSIRRNDANFDLASSSSSTRESSSELSDSSQDVQDIELDQNTTLEDNHGLSMSLASLFSEADIMKKPRGAPDGASDILSSVPSDVLSAEGVALSLISKFKEKHLPKASDLEWLVSEEDAPQALLPLPKNWSVNAESICEDTVTPLRGTKDWAPPRPQIVLTIHAAPDRKSQMEKQNYKCAGCGIKVAEKYASKYRYCEYLGKYFCTGCHKNQVALIPARVINKWDFRRYPVSTFSYKLLEQMYLDPLFRIFEINKTIINLCSCLELIRKFRLALCYIKEYIFTCRYAEIVQETLEQDLPSYFLLKPDEYSMDDLVNIKNGELKTKLKFLIDICCKHTYACKLCLARGFICELCKDENVIFPWQLKIVYRCQHCSMCYHLKCWNQWKSKICKKCERISKRKECTNVT